MSAVSATQRLKVAGFFLNLAEWDRHIEITRQLLNGLDSFEPYAAFLRLTGGKSSSLLEASDVVAFLKDNSFDVSHKSVQCVLQLNDSKLKGGMCFEDFLKFTLARDHPKSRFEAAAKREIYEVEDGQRLADEVEYCLARLFAKSCEFVERLRQDSESQAVFSERYLFSQLAEKSDKLDFNIIKRYFTTLKIVPKDSELIAVLRIIDINDDGLIDRPEFEYFIATVAGSSNHAELADKVKHRQTREKYEVSYSSKHTPTHSGVKDRRDRDRSNNLTGSKTELREYQTTSYSRGSEGRDLVSSRITRETKTTPNRHLRENSKEENRYEREVRELRQAETSGTKRSEIRANDLTTSVVREHRRISPGRVEHSTVERVTRIDDSVLTPTRIRPGTRVYERSYRREGENTTQEEVEKREIRRSRDGQLVHESTYEVKRSKESGKKTDLTAYSPKHESTTFRRSYVNA